MGKSTWLWPFSMAILNYQRVIVWLIHGVNMIGNVTLCKRFAISRVCQIMLNYKVGPRRKLSRFIVSITRVYEFMILITIVNRVSKPTYNWGGATLDHVWQNYCKTFTTDGGRRLLTPVLHEWPQSLRAQKSWRLNGDGPYLCMALTWRLQLCPLLVILKRTLCTTTD